MLVNASIDKPKIIIFQLQIDFINVENGRLTFLVDAPVNQKLLEINTFQRKLILLLKSIK